MNSREREIIQQVVSAFDAAATEKYEEERWEEFVDLDKVEPLRKLLHETGDEAGEVEGQA